MMNENLCMVHKKPPSSSTHKNACSQHQMHTVCIMPELQKKIEWMSTPHTERNKQKLAYEELKDCSESSVNLKTSSN